MVKGRFSQQLTMTAAEKPISIEQFHVLVKTAYESVTYRLMQHLLKSNDAYIQRMLTEDF